jgi:hypothetical protein
MPNVADYVVVSDANLEITFPNLAGALFSIPSTALLSEKAILSFQLDTGVTSTTITTEGGPVVFTPTPVNLKWKSRINGTKIGEAIHQGRNYCAVHEVFSGSLLHTGSDNQFDVSVESGTGTVRVSNIVVWFQHAV